MENAETACQLCLWFDIMPLVLLTFNSTPHTDASMDYIYQIEV